MPANTEFMEHVIYIMKNILSDTSAEKATAKETRSISIACIEPILITMCRYTKFLESSFHTMTIKLKLCQLIEIVGL